MSLAVKPYASNGTTGLRPMRLLVWHLTGATSAGPGHTLVGVRNLALADVINDDIRQMRSENETLFVEYKSSLDGEGYRVAEAVASFANTLGGWVLIGLGDDGTPSGWVPPKILTDRVRPRVLHQTTTQHRAGLWADQTQPRDDPLPTTRQSRSTVGMATDRRHPQPPEAPQPLDRARHRVNQRPRARDSAEPPPHHQTFARQPRPTGATSMGLPKTTSAAVNDVGDRGRYLKRYNRL